MFNLHFLRQLFAFSAIGAVAMAILAGAIALVRDTTDHDWYATGKLSLTEILIRIGFDERAETQYRTSDGEILTLTRHDLMFNGNALLARDWIFFTASGAVLAGRGCSSR